MVEFTAAGRMGNFLFECATALSYALKHDLDFTVPHETSNSYWSPLYLHHLQNKEYNPSLEKIQLFETGHEYNEIPFQEDWRYKNICIEGYRQSEKYFLEHREEILHLFNFPHDKFNKISLHARFGDYLTVKMGDQMKHVIVDEDYINTAIEYVVSKTNIDTVKVFSDDIPLFKQKFSHLYSFEYSTNTNEYDDMAEISCCHSHINSSSTFSWWGAWLNRNKNKVIVTQREWFNGNWMNLITDDIIPSNWIKL